MSYKKRRLKRKLKEKKKDHDIQYLNFDYEENPEKKKFSFSRKAWIIGGGIVGSLALIYIVISIFFMSHFFYNTKINGVDFSMKSVKAVENYMKTQVKGYELTVIQKDDVKDTISGKDIDLSYKSDGSIKKALQKQSAFLWPAHIFSGKDLKVSVSVDYDKNTLDQKIKNLKCISVADPTDSVNAQPVFDGTSFTVQKEVYGTRVDEENLTKKVIEFISGFRSKLNMQEEKCYQQPKFTSESKEVKAACDAMNNYLKANITYTVGTATEVIDKALISTWLSFDETMNVSINQDAVRAYMKEFGKKYDTVGKTKSITTPTGKTVDVSGGTYGWAVDEDAETQALIANIQNGETISREPAYAQKAVSHDAPEWGNTYIEVDLSTQHMWYISNGAVAFETDVVTGVPTPEKETPSGVYDILEKRLNKTLTGEMVPETGKPEYETPVSHWARVTWTGIGFHTANWQTSFGGEFYKNGRGSHGCINMSYSSIVPFYDMISVGTPVIIHN